jgi:hypothetical protein
MEETGKIAVFSLARREKRTVVKINNAYKTLTDKSCRYIELG